MISCLSGCDKLSTPKTNVSDERLIEVKKEKNEDYYGYLIIPKIDMNLGFYNVDNENNNVNKNIEFIPTGILNTYLIAGHSGTGKRSYFTSLKELVKDDEIILKLESKEFHYQVRNIKRVPKIGKIKIKNEQNMLILTTCDQVVKGYQLIIEANIV